MNPSPRQITRIAGILCMIAGTLTVLGWIMNIELFKALIPGFTTIKINTAICLTFSGLALFLFSFEESNRPRWVLPIVAFIIMFTGLLTLFEFISKKDVGIDQLLIADNRDTIHFPGRMSFAAAASLTLVGFAFLIFYIKNKTLLTIAQYALHLVTVVSFIAIIGYLYGVPTFYNLTTFNPMALPTAILLFIISVSASFIHPHLGITGLFTGNSIGNIMARKLFPLLVLIIVVLGYLRVVAKQYNIISENFGIALFAASFLFVGLFLIWNTALRLNKINTKLGHSEERTLSVEKQLRHTMDNMLEGGQLVGFDWKYLYVNDAFCKHAKYSKEELLGYTVLEKFPGIENTEIYNVYQRCFKERVPIQLINHFVFPDGSEGWFELSFQPVPEGIFILSVDITERKKAELALIESNKALERRAQELQASNTELERFAYVASHDLQEPLRMVSSFLHLLERKLKDNLDDQSKQYIGFAVDGAERMKKLIQDLLLYSRVGTNKDLVTEVDFNEVMNTVKSMLSLSIQETKATIISHPLPTIKAVHPQMVQLFQNLVGNAIKYHGAEPPEIEIGALPKNGGFEFYIKDNGIGIDPRFFDKVFIIFQRLHHKEEYSGTGIGLSICKKIVERHGGTIRLESEPGKGSTFIFKLPKN